MRLALRSRSEGFTMVELVVVIVLIGILAVVGANLIGNFVGGYVDASERQELASAGRIAVERATRELRRAVPNSVLCPAAGCSQVSRIAVLRAATGGRYVATGPADSRLQINRDGDRFEAYGLVGLAASHDLVVYPQNASPLYGTATDDDNPRSRMGTVTDLSSGNEVRHRIDLDAADSFPRHSPSRRIYGVDKVVALCCDTANNRVRLGIGELEEPLGTTPGHFCNEANSGVSVHLLADRVSQCDITYVPATLTRSAIVRLFLQFRSPEAGETVDFLQEVQIRNVP
ncbi:prepilin-type N-terminal cleavage/methylation domain-containing protein [Thiohalorhabdus sp.]|uniref:prepilin-type N-terminal cleavage/methylation domain-containing protein n=1 Tax=Thiohalorhabdus sp. TaxID=3094134 RepID=UPI002FC30992